MLDLGTPACKRGGRDAERVLWTTIMPLTRRFAFLSEMSYKLKKKNKQAIRANGANQGLGGRGAGGNEVNAMNLECGHYRHLKLHTECNKPFINILQLVA